MDGACPPLEPGPFSRKPHGGISRRGGDVLIDPSGIRLRLLDTVPAAVETILNKIT